MNEFSMNKSMDKYGPVNYSFSKAPLAQNNSSKGLLNQEICFEKENCLAEQNSKGKSQYILSGSKKVSVLQFTDQKNKALTNEKLDLAKAKKSVFDTTYSKDYFLYLRTKELDSVILDDYISRQREIGAEARIVMVDYYMELKATLGISMSTIFLATQFIDVLLNMVEMKSSEFFLIGMATLLIASKMEDNKNKCLELELIMKLSNGMYTEDDIVLAEKSIMELNYFKLGLVTRYHYVEKLWKVFKSERNLKAFELLTTLSIYDHKLNHYPASTVIYSLLEILENYSKSHAASSITGLVEDNGEFEAAKDYLEAKILDSSAINQCTVIILKAACKIRRSPSAGIKKTFGKTYELIEEIAKVQRH
jgi:pterin-4a-carbinolamine dehydratase